MSVDLSACASSIEMPPPSQSTPQPSRSLSAETCEALGSAAVAAGIESALAVAEFEADTK